MNEWKESWGCESKSKVGHLAHHLKPWVWSQNSEWEGKREVGKGEREGGGGEERGGREREEAFTLYTSLAWVYTHELCTPVSSIFASELGHSLTLLIFSPNLILLKCSWFQKTASFTNSGQKHLKSSWFLFFSLAVHIQLSNKLCQLYLQSTRCYRPGPRCHGSNFYPNSSLIGSLSHLVPLSCLS